MKLRPIFHSFQTSDLIHIIPRLIVAIILAQTLPFKFSGAEESVWIFEQIGWEPWGRYLIASIETVSTLLLLTNFYIFGAIISLSLISAANFLHFTKLGFIVNNDGGTLFVLSIIVIFCSLWIVLYWNMQRVEQKVSNFDFEWDQDDEDEFLSD
ncbi:DoxX family protein [Ekhidna sp.]|uniref:DoxX family protein n=1 Tax=Ekhidna sp. TaxID=2608089 RepID=UPI00329A1E22